ncbi:hypothetical protein GCM10007874_11270 [Labrys miyagiensis]|uniref:DUF5681 domain-containing protein n=1 Tax=Labrys miyagiensis TaxID=346912 RepID=A0ABQ6CIQ6_9HYPH|nr:DUF5681 domain-containing protein [Labrys miyagiensis]GLS18111.1 hypothetical protein GCM10007874_11270 [Labrys miyagiensis]
MTFKPGQSGNPAGKPPGSRHKATLAAEALLDGEAEGLTRKAVEMALAGDSVALRLCLDRIVPPRKDRPVSFALPEMRTAADAVSAMGAVANAVAGGELTPGEAAEFAKLIDTFTHALETLEFDERLRKLEEKATP